MTDLTCGCDGVGLFVVDTLWEAGLVMILPPFAAESSSYSLLDALLGLSSIPTPAAEVGDASCCCFNGEDIELDMISDATTFFGLSSIAGGEMGCCCTGGKIALPMISAATELFNGPLLAVSVAPCRLADAADGGGCC